MAAILAKKLGMTQVFLDDGRVERVTVLEAGPCPVTAIRTFERDGYEAVQLAFGATKEKQLNRPELGHLKKADAAPHKHLVEFRDEAGELLVGDTVTADTFAEGDKVKVAGVSKGKGFQGTIKRHNFKSGPKSHGSHNVRAPGSIGASAWPARVMKGVRGPGQMGNRRATQRGLTIVRVDAGPEPAARARRRARRPRRPRGGAQRWLMPRSSAATKKVKLDAVGVRRSLQRPARARDGPRRAQRAPRRQRLDEDARRGPRRRRQAVAPEGHGPRPRRILALADLDRRRHDLRPAAAQLHLQGQPQGTPRRAAQRAVGARRARLARDPRPRAVRRRAVGQAGRRADRAAGPRAARCSLLLGAEQEHIALSFRNLARVVGAAGRGRRRRRRDRRLDAARQRGGARRPDRPRQRHRRGSRRTDVEHTKVIIRPVVSEKSYVLAANDRYTFRVHPDAHKTQIRQAVEALFDVNVVEVRTMSVKSKPKRRGYTSGRTRAVEEGDRPGARGPDDSRLPGPAGPRGV